LTHEMRSIRLREKRCERVKPYKSKSIGIVTSSAAMVTVWFVAITGTMFACGEISEEVGKRRDEART
jgi:hypothetical protein